MRQDFNFRFTRTFPLGKVLFFLFDEYNFIMKILRVFTGLALAASILFTIFYGAAKISEKNQVILPSEYKGVITLWQIDSFEGGTGSRKAFLLEAARGFEKENEGVLVMVVSHTVSSAKKNMDEGIFPDLISYGCGTGIKNATELGEKEKIYGGEVLGTTYAVPWCRGGYCIISNPRVAKEKDAEDSDGTGHFGELLVSQGDYTQPLAAFALEGCTAENITVMSPMNAYVKFTEGKTPYFLATQRDIVRLTNRGAEFEITPLTKYNDLYQYISVVGQDATKNAYAEKFVDYILRDEVQEKLWKINMFSARIKTDFDSPRLEEMQGVNHEMTVSAFTSPEELKNMQEISLAAAKGNQESLLKIKNFIL